MQPSSLSVTSGAGAALPLAPIAPALTLAADARMLGSDAHSVWGALLMAILVFIGVALSAIGALILTLADGGKETRSGWRRVVAGAVFVGVILGAGSAAIMHGQDTREIAGLQRQLRERTDSILASVTGGDAYCSLSFSRPFTDRSRVLVFNHSDRPLYDVVARVIDVDRCGETEGLATASFEELSLFQTVLQVGNLPPHAVAVLGSEWDFTGESFKEFSIFFTARNGFWEQQLFMLREPDTWTRLIRVFRDDHLLAEIADDRFPREKAPMRRETERILVAP